MAKTAIFAVERTSMSRWREKVIDAEMGLFRASGALRLPAPLSAKKLGERAVSEFRSCSYGRSAERRAPCPYQPRARRARRMRLGG